MKINITIFSIIALMLSGCMENGADTLVLPDYRETYLPQEIASTWKAAIKCAEESEDAIELTLTTLSDSENFSATGTGYDYDGTEVKITVNGIYSKELNTLSADVKYTFVEAGTFRLDHFAVDLNFYTPGTYIDMIKLDESYPGGYDQSCDTQIKLFY